MMASGTSRGANGIAKHSLPIEHRVTNGDPQNRLASPLLRPDGAGWVEKALHENENEIEPATELVPDLPEMGDRVEPQALAKPDRGVIRRVYAADHDVLPEAESKRK